MPRIKTKRSEREYLRRIGRTIRRKRVHEYHELQRNIADSAGVSTQYLWSIEQGTATGLSLLVLKRIAKALELDLNTLLTEAPSVTQSSDPLLGALLTRLAHLPETVRPAALLAMLTLLDDYKRFMNAASFNPHQLALPFAGEQRSTSTNARWLPSLRDDTTITPS